MWVGASNANQWEVVLKIKTPLGGIYFGNECLLKNCNLTVIDLDGNETVKKIEDCSYIFPNKVISFCKNLDDIREKQRQLIESGKDGSKLPDSFNKLNGLYKIWQAEAIILNSAGLRITLDEKEKELIQTYNLTLYSFFCFSVASLKNR